MIARRRTAVFAKCPRPGLVKTRLVPPLDAGQAARLSKAMLADAVERCAASRAFETVIAFAPAEELAWFRAAFGARLALVPQRGVDLGQRLARFFADEARARPAGTTVVIGSDQPTVTTATLVAAHAALEDGAELVVGPDGGGGTYLIGLAPRAAGLLEAVPMSTDDMLARTLAAARERGLACRVLPPGLDVDTARDLERLRAELSRLDPDAPEFPRRTARVLAELPRSDPARTREP